MEIAFSTYICRKTKNDDDDSNNLKKLKKIKMFNNLT